MPVEVTASDGTTAFHLFQLREKIKEYSETKGYTTLENDLSDGYEASVLFGSNTGLRRFRFTMPTLADFTASANIADINDTTVTPREYLRSLFDECKISGTPFVFQSIENDQYYLVKFVENALSFDRLLVKLYSAGIELRQVRIEGVTIFDLHQFASNVGTWWYDETGHFSPAWNATDIPSIPGSQYGVPMSATGDVIFSANPQNSFNTVRLNSVSTNGKLELVTDPSFWREMFLVMKVREATFGQTSSVIDGVLVGTSGTTKFAPLSGFGSYEYRLNGVLYESSNLQAPMNSFGIVHLRVPGGFADELVTIGQSSGGPGSQAEIDIAQIYAISPATSMERSREITEYLAIKWGIGLQ